MARESKTSLLLMIRLIILAVPPKSLTLPPWFSVTAGITLSTLLVAGQFTVDLTVSRLLLQMNSLFSSQITKLPVPLAACTVKNLTRGFVPY